MARNRVQEIRTARTSARARALALVAAGIVAVSGCGGGSDSQIQSTQGSAAQGQLSDGKSSSLTNPTQKPNATEEATGTAPGGPASGSGKHGAHIVVPKGPRESVPTPVQRAHATVASMSLSSPALQPGPESTLLLPATYTCDGKDSWPPLRWAGVPQGTAELDLLVMNLTPVNGRLFFDWAVAGIDPSQKDIEAGRLPKGVTVGRNSFGKNIYSICPPGSSEIYIFALYALPKPIPAKRGFDPLALRKEVLASSGNAGLMAITYGHG